MIYSDEEIDTEVARINRLWPWWLGTPKDVARQRDMLLALKKERADLIHDIERYVAINTEYLADIEALREALDQIAHYTDGEAANIALAALGAKP